MPGDAPRANTSRVASTLSSTLTTEDQSLLPAGLAMPKPLKTEANLASNWKNRLNWFEDEFKTSTFLSCIGETVEILEGLDFASEEERTKFDIVEKILSCFIYA